MNTIILLAAGKGNRMRTEIPKCAIPLLGKPMIEYLVDTAEKIEKSQIICVVGHQKKAIMNILKNRVLYTLQEEQLGTAHAVQCASGFIYGEGNTIIIPGDTPLADETMLQALMDIHNQNQNDVTLITMILKNPFGFGRIIRDAQGKIIKIVEEKEASDFQKKVNEINTGILCVQNELLLSSLDLIQNKNQKNEYYLTDMIEILSSKFKIGSLIMNETYKLKGINDLYTLSHIENEYRKDILKKHMLNGVLIVNPDTIVVGHQAKIKSGTIIYPNTIILGNTQIGKNCVIGPNTEIFNAIIEDNVSCKHSVIYDSRICNNAVIGPFAHLRMNSIIGEDNRIGNFVEIKKSVLGKKTNSAHLSYIGDTNCGDEVNFGCGTVIVNYDGKNKHKTTIGNRVFIGCNSNLIAPIYIDSDSFIAAGSTITDSLSQGDFAIARAPQITKENYAQKYSFKRNENSSN